MITDPSQFSELIKVIQTNPDLAAAKLAQLGMTPDQFMQTFQPSFVEPTRVQGIAPSPDVVPNTLGTFAPGPAVLPQAPTPMNAFTVPGPDEVPMSTPVASTQAIPGDPMIPGFGPQVAGMVSTGPSVIGDWSTQVQPAAGQDTDMSKLFAGLKGMPSNADTKPIFGANAPLPRDINGSGKVANAASMDQILKLLMTGVKGPQVPTIGGLMGRA